jgi:uncharacterized membrane protein YhaH (DUF805 family)
MRKLIDLLRFDGRLSRVDYWRAYLWLAIVGAASWCLGLLAIIGVGGLGAVLLLPLLPVAVASLGIVVRRLHDRGRSGWWILPFTILPTIVSFGSSAHFMGRQMALAALALIASFILSIWGFVEIGLRRGAPVGNRYGEAPQRAA